VSLSESEIRQEIERYVAFKRAYRERHAAPKLGVVKASALGSAMTLMLHAPLAVVARVARWARAHRTVALVARARIASDGLSYEPRSCGLNAAYTNLGLALLRRNDVAGAIRCLDASWHVHPCPHTVSFGLSQRLSEALMPYPDARSTREQYERMSRLFVSD
jgi:hypothetical protein